REGDLATGDLLDRLWQSTYGGSTPGILGKAPLPCTAPKNDGTTRARTAANEEPCFVRIEVLTLLRRDVCACCKVCPVDRITASVSARGNGYAVVESKRNRVHLGSRESIVDQRPGSISARCAEK